MDPPAGQASEHFSSTNRMPSPWPQGHIPEPYPSGPSPNAEPYSPRSIWDQDSYLLGPFPSSPLQPLPPARPPSPQEQSPPFSPWSPCKARKQLFNELRCTIPDAPQVRDWLPNALVNDFAQPTRLEGHSCFELDRMQNIALMVG